MGNPKSGMGGAPSRGTLSSPMAGQQPGQQAHRAALLQGMAQKQMIGQGPNTPPTGTTQKPPPPQGAPGGPSGQMPAGKPQGQAPMGPASAGPMPSAGMARAMPGGMPAGKPATGG